MSNSQGDTSPFFSPRVLNRVDYRYRKVLAGQNSMAIYEDLLFFTLGRDVTGRGASQEGVGPKFGVVFVGGD